MTTRGDTVPPKTKPKDPSKATPSTTWQHINSEPSPPVGKRLRDRFAAEQAKLVLPKDRDPLAILEKQHETRLPDLVPVRIGRMLESPFAYYRGTAGVMAADLRGAPGTGVDVVACGDAHISNFGFFATPERELVFDLNDFDEPPSPPGSGMSVGLPRVSTSGAGRRASPRSSASRPPSRASMLTASSSAG